MSDDDAAWPSVSVVMPIRNEAAHLERAVAAVLGQRYPGPLDICLAVAPSSDGTEQVAARIAATHAAVGVVGNPSASTPAGLNAAITATAGDVVVRVDGHCELSAGYIRRAVETMRRTGAVNVGGIQRAVGHTPFERAVAIAMTSRLGTGGSRFHVGGDEGPVDTVYLGVFRRDALEIAGLFDEHLVRNQDYELNIRLRAAGGVVWFDPLLSATYRPRSSVAALARQYFEYGQWKREVVRMHPGSVRPRQIAVPTAMAGVAAGVVLGARWRSWLVIPGTYLGAALVSATWNGARRRASVLQVLGAYVTMHFAWAAGFLVGGR